jgi:hypothetical protein
LNAQYLLGDLRGGHTEDIMEAMSPKFVPAGEKHGIYALLHFRSRAPWHPNELIESLVDLGCFQQDPYGRISAPGVDVRAGGFRRLTAFSLDRKWRWYNRFLVVRA